MSNFSYTLDELQPLTPEQLAAIDPELLRDPAASTPGRARFLGPNEMAEPPEIVETPVKTPAEILAEQNRPSIAAIESRAREIGGRVSGKPQDYIDELVAGAASGKYSAADVNAALTGLAAQYPQTTTPATTTTTTTTATDPAAAVLAQQRSDAFSRLRALLNRVGLDELSGSVQTIITSGQVDLGDPNAILFALRDQPAYRRRFAGNAARAKKGLPELDPGSYVQLEESYRQLMRNNGLPAGFYDQNDDFTKFIENDVSISELNERIQQGYRAVQDADPEVKRQMRELYGVDESGLTAYFLDPTRAAPLLSRQAQAARVAARGREQAGLQLTALSAEELAARGITPEEAERGFAQFGAARGLYEEMAGEEPLTEQQKIGAAFGYDVAAAETISRRKARRVAEFKGGGGFTRTTGATSGTVETGLGGPQ
jgi:hypothetical protein